MYEGLDWESDKTDAETRHGRIVYRGSETEGEIGVSIRERGDPAIQGQKENTGAIEIV